MFRFNGHLDHFFNEFLKILWYKETTWNVESFDMLNIIFFVILFTSPRWINFVFSIDYFYLLHVVSFSFPN